MEKIAVVAPIPSVNTISAATVKLGETRRARAAWRRSAPRPWTEKGRFSAGGVGSVQRPCFSAVRRCASRLSSVKAARVRRVASSGAWPCAINSRQRSSRCCDSSSMISASRVGERETEERRARISGVQSGMLPSRDEAHGLDEAVPGLLLLREHTSAGGGQPVEPSPALPRLLHPGPLDPAALFEAVEQGIEGVDVEDEPPVRARFDQLAQLIPMARPVVEQREQQQFCRSLLQLAIQAGLVDICHRQI